MKLSEHIELYHGGNVKRFSLSVNKPYTTVLNQVAAGWSIDNSRVFDVKYDLTKSEIEHVKKVRGGHEPSTDDTGAGRA